MLRLRKALYGLRQALRAWNIKLDARLASLGFTKCATEHALYTRQKGHGNLIVGVYVDDLIITGSEQKDINDFQGDDGSVSESRWSKGCVASPSDSAYAMKLLERGGMGGCKPCQSLTEKKIKLSKASTAPKVNATSCRNIVGRLRYLAHTRPDTGFAIGYLSRFMEDPQEDHLAAIKHLLRYIAGTIDYGIVYPRGGGQLELIGFTATWQAMLMGGAARWGSSSSSDRAQFPGNHRSNRRSRRWWRYPPVRDST